MATFAKVVEEPKTRWAKIEEESREMSLKEISEKLTRSSDAHWLEDIDKDGDKLALKSVLMISKLSGMLSEEVLNATLNGDSMDEDDIIYIMGSMLTHMCRLAECIDNDLKNIVEVAVNEQD